MSKLRRIAIIVVAYVAASIVAGAVALIGILVLSAGVGILTPSAIKELVAPIAIASGVAALTALVPTLPVGIYAERHAKRLPGWYAVAGIGIGIAALLVYVLASEVASRSVSNATAEDARFLLMLCACIVLAGACSGVTYWWIAGRNAGSALPQPSTAASAPGQSRFDHA